MRLAKRRRVRPSDPMAVVTRFLEAANQHDADTLYATVHPEFESFQPLHPARNFRGPGQLISNWKAIFEAEPGFRLTMLRASTTGNTVWVEVHGAGDTAEAAGIFIVGVENSRIRWVRVYSDLVEPAPERPLEDSPPAAAVAAPETVETREPAATGSVTSEAAEPVTAEPLTPEPAASEPDTATPEPEPAVPEPEPVVPDPVPTPDSAAPDLRVVPDDVSPSETQSAPRNEGLWAAADTDLGSPTPAASSGDASPWLVEAGGGSPDGPHDESPAPPEPGLRLVAPAPLPDPGTGLGSTVDETTVETLVGPATPPTGPLGPRPTTDPEPAAADGDGAVTDDAESQPAKEPAPVNPPPGGVEASSHNRGETDPPPP
ncbi:MAG: nuclear transport factor 2 family protein, partial [Acidimicrobiales bacterium]